MGINKREKILIVQDGASQIQLYLIQLNNYSLTFVESCEKGFSLLEKQALGMAIVDISLNGPGNGVDFLKYLK